VSQKKDFLRAAIFLWPKEAIETEEVQQTISDDNGEAQNCGGMP